MAIHTTVFKNARTVTCVIAKNKLHKPLWLKQHNYASVCSARKLSDNLCNTVSH